MKVKLFLAAALIACVCLSACSRQETPSSASSDEASQPGFESTSSRSESTDIPEQESVAYEALLTELIRRGFPDYRGVKMQPYTGNVTSCVSVTEEFDPNNLLKYQVFTDPDYPSNYQVIAISKDLQYFFILNHVDGALYDIRDLPAYLHEGEYGPEDSRQKLESYLLENTDIDPLQYDFYVEARHIDGEDNYYIVLNSKDVEEWSNHSFEFYVSKDLKRIAQIFYDDALGIQYIYLINEK